MPILDPILQFHLSTISISQNDHDEKISPDDFYIYILALASKYNTRNVNTLIASRQFKKDFEKFFPIILKYFNWTFEEDVKKFPNIYYAILESIDRFIVGEECLKGEYYLYNYIDYSSIFFKINFDNHFRSWILSDTPIAILSLNLNKMKNDDINSLLFEVNLFASINLTLILCISNFLDNKTTTDSKNKITDDSDSKITKFDELIQIFYIHPFAEIHVTYDSAEYNELFSKFVKTIDEKYEEFNSYFYFYVRYFETDIEYFKTPVFTKFDKSAQKIELNNLLQQLKKKPRFNLTRFNESIEELFKKSNFKKVNESKHGVVPEICQDGFGNDQIKIILSDISVFEKEDPKQQSFSCDFSNDENFKSFAYISTEDFLFFEKQRVKAKFVKYFTGKRKEKITKFLNFTDIHFINPGLYVDDQLSMFKIKENLKAACKRIIKKLNKGYTPIKEDDLSHKNKKKNDPIFDEEFINALCAYKQHHDSQNSIKFEYHLSQIYSAYEMAQSSLIEFPGDSGVVYQIPTGEGKTAIILLIAAVLAKMKKIVHIVSSNVYLTNRDYNESYQYFKNIGIRSTALLHYNEVPIYSKQKLAPYIRVDNYGREFFGEELFNNSMNINFSVCDKSKNAQIIFSTITNFECYYLYMSEKRNGSFDDYYRNAVLIIDEADSILIDEITNGTIISKPLKSNSQKVLTFAYKEYLKNNQIEKEELLSLLKNKFSECANIEPEDVDLMLKEIRLVNDENSIFVYGKKYLFKPKIVTIKKPGQKDINEIHKEIIPFDYDNKGILEENKQYGGFIEQFISIKEMLNRKDEKIDYKDISLNYMYISHPIYIKLYGKVFGLTGTIGDSYDRELILKHYKLATKIMPKEHPYRCYHFPVTLFDDIKERNSNIVNEIIAFHKRGFPVLVIFFSPDEINSIKKLIKEQDPVAESFIKIYDGKDMKIKPSEDAGKIGAITLGTNVCGRGTHIEVDKKHLHVIISFYSSNKRAIHQAFGRTARKNNFGSVHIICQRKEFNLSFKYFDDKEEEYLQKLNFIRTIQKQFIDEFRQKRNWIFNANINYTKKFSLEERQVMRSTKLNVNRKTAFDFKYPICMDYQSFLDFQAQKIFSLYNCPNCKYTWQIFQQYVREMILQSWSIFINKTDIYLNSEPNKIQDIIGNLKEGKNKLVASLKEYLPDENDKTDIFESFYHIFKKVNTRYQPCLHKILPSFDSEKGDSEIIKKSSFLSRICLEFRPFMFCRSGSRIKQLLKKGDKTSYFQDPELNFIRKETGKLFSITNTIDSFFDMIFDIFNDFLEDKINFKFFLRRTLSGCEFGICYEFEEDENEEEEEIDIDDYKNCMFDKKLILVFSININSTVPFLAGVLVFLIIYLVSIINNIINIVKSLIKGLEVIGSHLIKFLLKFLMETQMNDIIEDALDQVIDRLKSNIDEMLLRIKDKDKDNLKFYYIIKMLSDIMVNKMTDKIDDVGGNLTEKISRKFSKQFTKLGKLEGKAKEGLTFIFKIGFLLVLLLATHMLNFHFNFQFNKKLNYNSEIKKSAKNLKENHDQHSIQSYVDKNSGMVEVKINPKPKLAKMQLDLAPELQNFVNQLLEDPK